MNGSARIVIIGGGVIGLGIAYHLAELGVSDVVLLERHQLTSGTSWHAAGIVGPLRASLNLTRLAQYATELFPRLEKVTGQASGYRRTGGLWLARRAERMDELKRIAHLGDVCGLTVEIVDQAGVAEHVRGIVTDGVEGALWVEEDGQANPVDICAAYAKRARAAGIRILEGLACSGIVTRNGRVAGVKLASGVTIDCETVVNCAGAWARDIGALAGVPVPLQAVEHMYVVTEPIAGLQDPFPILRDLDEGIYIKGDSGKLVLGGFEPNAKLFDVRGPAGDRPFLELPEDWEQFEPFMSAGLKLLPALSQTGIRHFMNGPESFTPDTRPLMGESPYLRGFYVAAGFNSTGMMSSAGAGKAMAEWIVDGEPSLDLWALDIARFDRAAAARSFVGARMEEAVADLFRMHWPYKQAAAGREVRRSAFHRTFAEAGAVFGAPTGWERPLWFGGTETRGYSVGAQKWWSPAKAEAERMAQGVGLFELSPFTKIDVRGRDAIQLMQSLCAGDVDRPEGRAVYTQMLNARGGIEADVTVTRVDEHGFRVISGAATRQKDFAWIARHAEDLGLNVSVFDATSAEAVLGVMGPNSRALLQSLTDVDLSDAAFPFSTSRRIDIGTANVRATRVSFVGELGFELYVPVEHGESLLAMIVSAGGAHGLTFCGHYALDGCRLEKGYRHWGHDIGPKDTPLEAGLSFAVSWKRDDFIGRDALLKQKADGLKRRLMHFAVDGDNPLLLHDEPIYRDGKLAGLTTSGGLGVRTGLSLCLGYVACDPGEAKTQLLACDYQIAVAGARYRLRPLDKPPYDPTGSRMRVSAEENS
ncbi:FAD-dependent oxidoreductase [Mesorhizobium sp. B1-1-4]|uniref:FAD-dependent oxidoreductase n=1 Tax=Mesorhizobium sp. B1-1-4 TaxID=2589980 RepID=UPI0011278BA6|nr:FAD-dependent oxidoreductase [Mesorhizobium sp. B1-1-4]TPN46940.1 FAD-dependent oxidoreductase [Mesorhizobium sp. B1-1-4]